MPEKHVNVLDINLTLAPEVDRSNATAPQISPYPPSYGNGFAPPTAGNGFASPGGFAPPSNENSFAPPDVGGADKDETALSRFLKRLEDKKDWEGKPYPGNVPGGKTMQVGSAIHEDVDPKCIEGFCEDCQKRVSTVEVVSNR